MRITLQIAGVAMVGLLAACTTSPSEHMAANVSAPFVTPLAMPVGITIQDSGAPLPNQGGYDRPLTGAVYADAKGMALYTFDKDTQPGVSTCSGECAAVHPPLKANPGVAVPAEWAIIDRGDGAKQWAYRGKPLYTSTKDTKISQTEGKDAEAGWKAAMLEPGKGAALPAGVNIQEFVNAGGQAYVDDRGFPLYTFDGDAEHDRTACVVNFCSNQWTPFVAAQLAKPVGAFSVIDRGDGIHQWTLHGKPLYSFDGDTKPGDAVGASADPRWHVALLVRYFVPDGVVIAHNHFGGFNFATADGMTLYQRGRWRPVNGGHVVRAGSRDHPYVGRLLGTTSCDASCTPTWRPLKAPAEAVPSGYWEVMTRDDGSKQWAYQGYPLYTYAGDKRPGDMAGNDVTDYMPLNGKDVYLIADKGGRREGGGGAAAAMYWHATLP